MKILQKTILITAAAVCMISASSSMEQQNNQPGEANQQAQNPQHEIRDITPDIFSMMIDNLQDHNIASTKYFVVLQITSGLSKYFSSLDVLNKHLKQYNISAPTKEEFIEKIINKINEPGVGDAIMKDLLKAKNEWCAPYKTFKEKSAALNEAGSIVAKQKDEQIAQLSQQLEKAQVLIEQLRGELGLVKQEKAELIATIHASSQDGQ